MLMQNSNSSQTRFRSLEPATVLSLAKLGKYRRFSDGLLMNVLFCLNKKIIINK